MLSIDQWSRTSELNAGVSVVRLLTYSLFSAVCAPDDAERVVSIYNRYVSKTTVAFETEPVPVEVMRGRIDSISSAFPYFVYEYDGELIGYCYAHLWKEREAYSKTLETTVYLAPEACHKGIGPLLMTHLIDECRRQGYHALIACITADNLSSLRFHQRLGFRQVSRFSEVGRKFDRWLDVIDLELIL
uniref:GNAT family N-acetyltransferase n=1 Tax=Candidatus Cryptobacteroides bacterium TaxID=3085639 RepID=UPI004025431E